MSDDDEIYRTGVRVMKTSGAFASLPSHRSPQERQIRTFTAKSTRRDLYVRQWARDAVSNIIQAEGVIIRSLVARSVPNGRLICIKDMLWSIYLIVSTSLSTRLLYQTSKALSIAMSRYFYSSMRRPS